MKDPIPLRDLAEHLGREVEGDADFCIEGVASLDDAGAGDLGFVRGPRYASALAGSSVGAVIAPHGMDVGGRPTVRSANPGLDFARAVAWLEPDPRPDPGVHPAAHVEPGAKVAPTASVGPGCVVGARSRIGSGTVLHPNVTVYPDVAVGADCTIHSGSVLRERTVVGDRVILQPGVVLGGDGFGYTVNERGAPEKIPQVGGVVIGDDVEIGANAAVDCGALGDTRVGRGTKIDNLVMIGHNCDIGEDVFIVAQSGLSGSTVVGEGAMIMAQCGVANHARIGARVFLAPKGGVIKDVPDGARVGGYPHQELRTYQRSVAALRKLPELVARVRSLERHLGLKRSRSEGEDG